MQYLVMGANGYLGSYLYKRMKLDELNVIGTGHIRKGEKDLIPYDILKDSVSNITKNFGDNEKTVIFCIAQANLEKCRIDYELSRQINVLSVKKVIEKLVEENFHIIYFSTDNVFDGTKGNYTEWDKTHAVSQYGKMKEEMEHFLLNLYPQVCIFRMPRVVGTEREKQNLLTDMESKLADGQMKCIKNNQMSVIAKEDIYQACLIAAEKKMKGLYNLANGEIYTRKELAERFFKSMGVKNIEIVELELEKFDFQDVRPLNVGLDNSKFKQETGYQFITYDMLVNQYLGKSK